MPCSKSSGRWIFAAECCGRLEAAFTGFSLYSNLRRVFSPDAPRTDFAAVHFLRFFSLCYLMLGETYFLGTLFTEIWAVGEWVEQFAWVCSPETLCCPISLCNALVYFFQVIF